MNGIAPKIAQEIAMLFNDGDIDTCSRKEEPEHEPGRASAGNPDMLNGAMLLFANGKSGSSTVANDGAGPGMVGYVTTKHALTGLTTHQARQAVAAVMMEDGRLDAGDIEAFRRRLLRRHDPCAVGSQRDLR